MKRRGRKIDTLLSMVPIVMENTKKKREREKKKTILFFLVPKKLYKIIVNCDLVCLSVTKTEVWFIWYRLMIKAPGLVDAQNNHYCKSVAYHMQCIQTPLCMCKLAYSMSHLIDWES